MDEAIAVLTDLFKEGFFYPWVRLPFLNRWLIPTLVVGVPMVYLQEWFLYKRLAGEARRSPHIVPIYIRGGISDKLGSHAAGMILRAHMSAIIETFRKAQKSDGTLHGEVIALVSASLNLRPSEHPTEFKLEEELIVKIGKAEIPISRLVNLLLVMWRLIPLGHRDRYLTSMIQVSLMSSGDQTQLMVSRRGDHAVASSATEITALTDTRKVRCLSDLSELIRDGAFMVFHLVHGRALPGSNWRGMKHFVCGLDVLDEFRRTKDKALLTRAMESFRDAAMSDSENYKSLYIQGSLLFVQRDKEAIRQSLNLLTEALKSNEPAFRAFVNAGLANCYVTEFHRLAKREVDNLNEARKRAEQAGEEWLVSKGLSQESIKQPLEQMNEEELERMHPWILATRGKVWIVDDVMIAYENQKEAEKMFVKGVTLLLKAVEKEKDNGTYYNLLGWALMKLADWESKALKPKQGILPKGSPAEKAEYCFKEALKLDPTSKFIFANLCLLYSTPWYLRKPPKIKQQYLQLCRVHGKRAVELDKQYTHGYRDLAFSLLKHGQFEVGFKEFKKALKSASEEEKREEMRDDARRIIKDLHKRRLAGKDIGPWGALLKNSKAGQISGA